MPHQINWIAKGQKYQPNVSGGATPHEPGDIPIPEEDGLKLPGGPNVFGEPVDAPLAVYYIRKLWQEVLGNDEHENLLKIADNTKKFFSDTKDYIDNDLKDFTKEEFKMKLDALTMLWEKANHWLVALLDNSFGITMDKSTMMKTLSQPGCEGMRFYLALKNKADEQQNEKKNETLSGELPIVLTLVTVGVDQCAKDLHFKFDSQKQDLNEIPDIETSSLCTEYPRTPMIVGKHGPKTQGLEPYVLYQYSIFEKQKDHDKYKQEK